MHKRRDRISCRKSYIRVLTHRWYKSYWHFGRHELGHMSTIIVALSSLHFFIWVTVRTIKYFSFTGTVSMYSAVATAALREPYLFGFSISVCFKSKICNNTQHKKVSRWDEPTWSCLLSWTMICFSWLPIFSCVFARLPNYF